MRRLESVAVHCERLHDDRVWYLVERVARAAANRGQFFTFFIHPFWPALAGCDISERARRLAVLGHEVGQHTHYYDAATTMVPFRKRTDLNTENVVRRLNDDYVSLMRAGVRPRGFVSGAWALPDVLPRWLAEHGFSYDCTYRTHAPPQPNRASRPDDRAAGPFPLENGVLEVPTTASLRAAAMGLLRPRRQQPLLARLADVEYRSTYLHDHDLLDVRKRGALAGLLWTARWRKWPISRSDELAELIRPLVDRTAR